MKRKLDWVVAAFSVFIFMAFRINAAPYIALNGYVGVEGELVELKVFTSDRPESYAWFYNGNPLNASPIPNTNLSFSFTNSFVLSSNTAGAYRFVAYYGGWESDGNEAQVIIRSPKNVTQDFRMIAD